MDIRNSSSPKDFKNYDTSRIRSEFLIEKLFVPGEIILVYSHFDRIIAGGICPTIQTKLEAGDEIRAAYFLERREMGIINIGSSGTVTVDGVEYHLETNDGLYVGMGSQEILFQSDNVQTPSKFYINSTPAHSTYPTVKIGVDMLEATHLGSLAESNERTIYKYIHPAGVKSCQLVMGMTILEPGSVWNTMPTHTHARRMEVYLYFNMSEDSLVFHNMGEPSETRHVIMRNEQAVISPSWSIHSGCGTRNYTFIWGMCGENQTFTDMDAVKMSDLK